MWHEIYIVTCPGLGAVTDKEFDASLLGNALLVCCGCFSPQYYFWVK